MLEISSATSQKKPHSSNLFNTFFTEESANHSKHQKISHKNNKFLNNFPFKFLGGKSNSTDKTQKIKGKFGQNKNYSKHYCITLNQYAQYKQDYLSLNSKSNSKNKSKTNRPSTASHKNKNHKRINNKKGTENKNNFIGFNGIVNIRTNLVNNSKNNGLKNNKNYKIKETIQNNEFNTLFNPHNNGYNNIFMNDGNRFSNNKFMVNIGNNNGNSKNLVNGKKGRINSSRIVMNQSGNKNSKQNNVERIRLSSAIINNTILLSKKNQKKK